MKATTAPLVTLGLLLTLSCLLKPAGSQPLADKSCKVTSNEQTCLVVFKHYERTAKGWTIYLLGSSPLQVQSSSLPVVPLGSTLKVTLQNSPIGLQLTDWSKAYP